MIIVFNYLIMKRKHKHKWPTITTISTKRSVI